MSRLRITPHEPTPIQEVAETPFVKTYHILTEAVPVPVGTNEYDPVKVRKQGIALVNFRKQAKDVFEANECRCVTNAGSNLYQTQETYGTGMSVEQMVQTMEEEGLTMRVNFRRPGIHSATTCMELSAEHLTKLMEETADSKNQKTLELRIKAESQVAVPKHGAMFVTVVQDGAVHTMSHIDYKIMASYDQMYHAN